MATPVIWEDPCARVPVLRKAYYEIISGMRESEFEYHGNGVLRRARYTQADLGALRAELRVAEQECAATTGATSMRVSTIRLATSKGL